MTDTPPSESRIPLPSTDGANRIVHRWALWSAGLGLVPIPLLEFATTTAFSLRMLRELSHYYGVDFRGDLGKSTITSLLAGAAAPGTTIGLVSLVRFVPVLGAPLALVSGPVVAGSLTYAVGRMFTAHFGSGGTLFDFDPERFRDYFHEQIEAGKAYIRRSETDVTADPGVSEPPATAWNETKAGT